ncbi:hypothetical protein BAE44_0021859 [Dichanthelium oligosanthes]|uniref:CCT domain-containing protein n=1 Tax=Dichanthelium oligosanthes TaxID=888268 RepID=A0A1E5UW09_9POAL|nr:hypothetical protein BAE44_0021859 [Dichanthelium oligosanthes]
MYPHHHHHNHHHHWGGTTCCSYGGVDGHELSCDAILSSRPDALLVNGGAVLPSPPSSYMLPPLLVGPPPSQQALSGMAAATSLSFRRAMSTGDLIRDRDRDGEEEQRVAAAAAPWRYSAEERRERIDKYRSKRNQRNFQKKITYACRKTLADSRPRVKGRFARNAGDYTDADADHHHAQQAAAAPPQSESEAVPERWPAAQQEALVATEEDELPAGTNLLDLCADDDDMLAAYLGVSISLYSPSTSTSTELPHHHYSCQP